MEPLPRADRFAAVQRYFRGFRGFRGAAMPLPQGIEALVGPVVQLERIGACQSLGGALALG
jgi:hypothetical protein